MTSCRQAHEYIDQYANGTIAAADAVALERHVGGCISCERRLCLQQRIAGELARQGGIPEPAPDFEARVLAAAAGRRLVRRRWTMPVIGGAIAAALVLGLALDLDSGAHEEPGLASVQEQANREVVSAEPREQTVRLAFHSRSQLDDVSLTLELPPHVELVQFPGHHQLTWQVNLKPGDNVIALPLRIAYPERGEIIARLDDGSKTKTFRAPIPGTGVRDKEPSS
ncbi:anti-sigma factor family protein [Marinobacter daqiaonensis]|nr:zf-HC2 domain-containing protein [Marinobacter daqiaonensis]